MAQMAQMALTWLQQSVEHAFTFDKVSVTNSPLCSLQRLSHCSDKRKVEVLLQRMFEDELDPNDLGADGSSDDLDIKPNRKYTFDMMVGAVV